MQPPNLLTDQALIAQAAWVRRLAYRLVQDHELAEDLAQDAYLAALKRRPMHHEGKLRSWLRTVLRNLWFQYTRSEEGRRRREQLVSKSEAEPNTDELVRRLETHRQIVAAVHELRDPYRTVILLRFFEDLFPRDIAEKLNVPVATVNSRITRAIHILRGVLDRRLGGMGHVRCIAFLKQPWSPSLPSLLRMPS